MRILLRELRVMGTPLWKKNLKGNFGVPSHQGNSLRKELAPPRVQILPLTLVMLNKLRWHAHF